MNTLINVKTYSAPAVDKKEILRYAGCKNGEDEQINKLVEECLSEALELLTYKLCYTTLSEIDIHGSKLLDKTLSGSERVIIFAATVGVEIDRLITKYGKISPAKAVIFQAIGAERIESLCNTFCAELKEQGMSLTRRVSPGYGDIALSYQRDIFALLDCPRKIGLTLNESLLMSPSKSVTAIMGVGKCESEENCSACEKEDCLFRRK